MFTLLRGRPKETEMKELIQEGVDINAKDQNGLTPLLQLVTYKRNSYYIVEKVSLLIKHGRVNIDSIDSNGKKMLFF
jgi:ankyrin repeat protein